MKIMRSKTFALVLTVLRWSEVKNIDCVVVKFVVKFILE